MLTDDEPLFPSRIAAELAGITYRQLDWWIRTGRITPARPAQGSGCPRGFSAADIQLLEFIGRLAQLVNTNPDAHTICSRVVDQIDREPWLKHADLLYVDRQGRVHEQAAPGWCVAGLIPLPVIEDAAEEVQAEQAPTSMVATRWDR